MVRTVASVGVMAWAVLGIISPGGVAVFAGTAIAGVLLFGAGYVILRVSARSTLSIAIAAILALPAGLIAGAGLGQILHHSFGNVQILIWGITLLAVPGLVLAVRETWELSRQRLKFGSLYAVAIVAVGLSYYVPKATQDSIRTPDGSYHWTYPDSAFHQAIAALVALDRPPLRNPGYAQVQMAYHYGRHALAAAIAVASGNSPGDCLARSLHWLGTASLLLAAIALGWVTARSPEQRPMSGLLAVVLVFFSYSFPSLVLNAGDSCSRHPQIILPEWSVVNELNMGFGGDGAMGHYLGSGSILWAGIVVLVVATLLHGHSDASDRYWKGLPCGVLLLSLAGMALNGVAGIMSLGVVVGFVLIRDRSLRGLAFAALAVILFGLSRHAMGLDQPVVGSETAGLGDLPFRLIRASVRGYCLLLSFQAFCIPVFIWGTRAGKLILGLFIVASLGLHLLFDLAGYPLGILSTVLAGFAAAPLAVVLHAFSAEDAVWRNTWRVLIACFRKYLYGMTVLMAVLLPLAWYPFFHHRTLDSIYGFSLLLPMILLACGGMLCVLRWMSRRNVAPSRAGALSVIVVLGGFSLAGWLRCEVNLVFDLLRNAIELDAGRVESLDFAQNNLPPESIFATTHHALNIRLLTERSYVYAALTQRYPLLEGWRYGGARESAGFEQTRRDNQLLFVTGDAGRARQIVQKYGITHLIVEPGLSLGFDATVENWLRPLQNPGTLAIFEVIGKSSTTSSTP